MSGQDLSDVLICSQADIDVASQLYRCANVMGPIVCLSCGCVVVHILYKCICTCRLCTSDHCGHYSQNSLYMTPGAYGGVAVVKYSCPVNNVIDHNLQLAKTMNLCTCTERALSVVAPCACACN